MAVKSNPADKPKKNGRRGVAHNPHGTADLNAHLTASPGEVSQIVANHMYWLQYPPVHTAEELAERMELFFKRCNDNDEVPGVEKLAVACGIDRRTLWDWGSGKRGEKMSVLVQKARSIIASVEAELANTGKIPQVVYIFRAKNFFDMRDQQEVVFDTSSNSDLSADPIALADKYKAQIGAPSTIALAAEEE